MGDLASELNAYASEGRRILRQTESIQRKSFSSVPRNDFSGNRAHLLELVEPKLEAVYNNVLQYV